MKKFHAVKLIYCPSIESAGEIISQRNVVTKSPIICLMTRCQFVFVVEYKYSIVGGVITEGDVIGP